MNRLLVLWTFGLVQCCVAKQPLSRHQPDDVQGGQINRFTSLAVYKAFGLREANSTGSEPSVEESALQRAFVIGLAVLLVIGLFSLGCKLDIQELVNRFRRPVNLLIGMACQFVLMPLLTTAIIMTAWFDWLSALGLFSCAISPGGGASNIYTDMFKGDIDLSMVMTFVSSVAAFGTVPLWLMFATNVLLPSTVISGYRNSTNSTVTISVPYVKITSSLASLTISSLIGLLVRQFWPDVARRISRIVRIVAIVFLLYVIVVGTVAYYEIFVDLNWKLVLCSVFLPWIGYLLGALASLITKRSKVENVAITLETGIQNTGIAIFICRTALNSAEYSRAIVAPVFYAISTPVLVIVCFSVRMVLERTRRKKEIKKQNVTEISTTEQVA